MEVSHNYLMVDDANQKWLVMPQPTEEWWERYLCPKGLHQCWKQGCRLS